MGYVMGRMARRRDIVTEELLDAHRDTCFSGNHLSSLPQRSISPVSHLAAISPFSLEHCPPSSYLMLGNRPPLSRNRDSPSMRASCRNTGKRRISHQSAERRTRGVTPPMLKRGLFHGSLSLPLWATGHRMGVCANSQQPNAKDGAGRSDLGTSWPWNVLDLAGFVPPGFFSHSWGLGIPVAATPLLGPLKKALGHGPVGGGTGSVEVEMKGTAVEDREPRSLEWEWILDLM